MSFVVAADSYDRFMGRYSTVLAPLFADFAGVGAQKSILDVGCGPGALTAALVDRLGADAVVAVDPSEPFVKAMRERFPGVEVHLGSAEFLPFSDHSFDAAVAQLVVHHMADPVVGIREMARVTNGGGTVAACVWDLGGGRSPLGPFWRGVARFDPSAGGESELPGTREGHLGEIFREAGCQVVDDRDLVFEMEHATFEEWWEPFILGVGPAGRYVAGLDAESRDAIANLCREELGPGPFTITCAAWATRASV
jgi:SAM-dependent methyltransferase